ncbi:hypothetical protein [Phenylobacterium sp.]|uniref:hypothetical protein n=1 Tax=Phenylobacterium sp. TaxID=1871053 RepID=UPI0025FF2644|nr:hypothetical protein [Phenylobacterium sp.]MBX3483290.1 hypothetical protein [Phenylobacterium sp.]
MGLTALALAGALMAQAQPAASEGAQAAAAAPAPAPAAEKAARPKPEKVCVTEAQLGSHFKKKICATPEEWEARRIRDQEAMSRNGGKAPPTCSGVAC